MPEAVKNKITIVHANALEWVADVKVDFLYAGLIESVAKNRKERNLSMGRMLKP